MCEELLALKGLMGSTDQEQWVEKTLKRNHKRYQCHKNKNNYHETNNYL